MSTTRFYLMVSSLTAMALLAGCNSTRSEQLASSQTLVPAETAARHEASTRPQVPQTAPATRPSTPREPVPTVAVAPVATTAPAIVTPTTTTAPQAPAPIEQAMDETAIRAVLSAAYSFNERSERVRSLQQLVGASADGWYGSQTRTRHLAALVERGMPTTNVPAAPTPAPSSGSADTTNICAVEQAVAFAHSILDPRGIPVPDIQFDPTITRSFYRPGVGHITLEVCESRSAIAHEIGHYVTDRANGMDFIAFVADVEAHFTGESWIRGEELYPGIEYAAHCVGNQLYGYGAFTKCPNATMAAYARNLIARAG